MAPPGQRDYRTGTERALFAFSGTTCYFPGCTAKFIIFALAQLCKFERLFVTVRLSNLKLVATDLLDRYEIV